MSKLNCPACGSPSLGTVIDSRIVRGTFVRRRRVCGDCGSRETTYEFSRATLMPIVDRYRRLRGLVKGLQREIRTGYEDLPWTMRSNDETSGKPRWVLNKRQPETSDQ
jgi:transcription elongation factor Elf1